MYFMLPCEDGSELISVQVNFCARNCACIKCIKISIFHFFSLPLPSGTVKASNQKGGDKIRSQGDKFLFASVLL